MTIINTKSGILSWSDNNVDNSPHECGVYILRTAPTTDSIKIIEPSSDLHEDLVMKIKDLPVPGIEFFDWYSTNTFIEAEALATLWREKYIH